MLCGWAKVVCGSSRYCEGGCGCAGGLRWCVGVVSAVRVVCGCS